MVFRKLLINYFLNSYLPSLKGVRITCDSLNDGAGAVFLRIYTAIIYSVKIDAQYIHTPIISLEHNYRSDLEYEIKWEKYFGFLNQYDKILKSDIIISISSFTHLFLYFIFYRFFYFDRIVFKYRFHNPDNIGLNVSEFISTNIYLASLIQHKYNYVNSNNSLNIVIHIRRGDVSINENTIRFTSNSEINNKLLHLKKLLEKYKYSYKIHLISQGSVEDFHDIMKVDFYHLNSEPIDDFDKMKNADILFTSKSSFSYLSAIFCSGLIIYEQFWLSPMLHWITIDKLNDIDTHFSKLIKTK